jgi:tetratricopeptide (TPR) repeat protein
MLGDSTGAEADMTHALRADDQPNLLVLRAMTQFEQGLYDAAEVNATAVIDTWSWAVSDVGLGMAYFVRAMSRYYRNAYAEAIDDASEAIRRSTDTNDNQAYDLAKLYLLRASAHNMLSHHSEAAADASEVIRLEGESERPLVRDAILIRANSRLWNGEFEGALADINELIKRGDEGKAKLYHLRAQALLTLGKNVEAGSDCETAQKIEPDNPQTQGCWGRLMLALGQYDDARSRFEDAERLGKLHGKSDWNFEIGLSELLAGRPGAALRAYQLGVEIEPRTNAAWALKELEFYLQSAPLEVQRHRVVSEIRCLLDNRVSAE